ncbi:MAG: hypothetical protein ACQEP7_00755, partial [bacterium]
MNLQKLLSNENTIFLDSGFTGRPLLFSEPEKVLTAHSPAEIKPTFEEIKRAVEAGYYCVGFISYEAGRILMDMPVRKSGFPHLWFGVFPRSKKMVVEDKKFRSPPPAIEPEAEIDYDRYRRGFQRIK